MQVTMTISHGAEKLYTYNDYKGPIPREKEHIWTPGCASISFVATVTYYFSEDSVLVEVAVV